MRRGTDAAVLFGGLLYEIRVSKGFSMQYVARQMGDGVYAAAVSQWEKGQRAVKESKLENLANVLEVDASFLRERWLYFQIQHPAPPVVRNRSKSSPTRHLVLELQKLTAPERERALGYIHRMLDERSADT